MFVATSVSLPKSVGIQQFAMKPSSRQTQRFTPRAPAAFIFQKERNTSDASDATKRRHDEDSSSNAVNTRAADSQHSSKNTEKTRAIPKAIEGTNLFSMDDDFSFLTVEDLLTA